jgi:hypothetical protein
MGEDSQDDQFKVLCVDQQILLGRMDPPCTVAGQKCGFCNCQIPLAACKESHEELGEKETQGSQVKLLDQGKSSPRPLSGTYCFST